METKEFGASPNRVSLRDHGFSRPVLNAKAQDGVRYAHEACDVGGFECAADGRLRRLRIGDDDEWLPFRFECLYDTAAATASAPRLVIGDGDPGRALPVRSGVAASLRDEVQSRLRREFRQQAVSFRLDRAAALDAGKRYARVEANGIADFGRDGRTPAGVEAIYDRRANAWIQVRYELGSTANRGDVLGG